MIKLSDNSVSAQWAALIGRFSHELVVNYATRSALPHHSVDVQPPHSIFSVHFRDLEVGRLEIVKISGECGVVKFLRRFLYFFDGVDELGFALFFAELTD
ncbi:hypothetical protein [Streptomyces laurentii]|uniref:hypothetical protein n=1 Tax=Streptomyces laurentii TaxID=39478 RepID=UPI0033F03863